MQSSPVLDRKQPGRARHRAVVLGLLAVLASLVFAGTAPAATDTSYALGASAYQNSTIAAALARVPAGSESRRTRSSGTTPP